MCVAANCIEQKRYKNRLADLSCPNFSFFDESQPNYCNFKNQLNILLICSEPNK